MAPTKKNDSTVYQHILGLQRIDWIIIIDKYWVKVVSINNAPIMELETYKN